MPSCARLCQGRLVRRSSCQPSCRPPNSRAARTSCPYFDGWIRNADGTFDLVFGYFNRNWEEELAIPAGPDNIVEPGGPDRGQPTYFLPRRQGWVFRVRVPQDFGKQVLTWTIKANGKTEKAYGELLPVEEITERIVMTRGNLNPGDSDPNKAPALTVAPIASATAGTPVALTAHGDRRRPAEAARAGAASDRRRPTRRGFRPRRTRRPPARPRGLGVTWMQLRGPARVVFEPAGFIPVADGKAAATARFTERGTYVLRATASDGSLSTRSDVTVTVGGGS